MRRYHLMKIFFLVALFYVSNVFAYRYDISAVMVFQNEAPYLKEWIEYHKLIGVQHFYLYNNGSVDQYMKVLAPYLGAKEVELFHCVPTDDLAEWIKLQTSRYQQTINKVKKITKWLLVIDLDEFVVPVSANKLADFLKNYEDDNIGGVYLWSIFFGTSYVAQIPENCLMIELLHMNRGPRKTFGKSIVRPERVKAVLDAHRCCYNNGFFCSAVEFEEAQINHYWTRDESYAYNYKWPRQKRWDATPESFEKRLNDFNKENPAYFEPIIKYLKPLRKRMFRT